MIGGVRMRGEGRGMSDEGGSVKVEDEGVNGSQI